MVQGILIPASDSEDMRLIELVGLEDYQAAVGGWIEAVDIADIGSTLFVNESGLMLGLRFNRRATYLWRYHLQNRTAQVRLVGDAVLVGFLDHHGESTDVPADLRQQLIGCLGYKVEVHDLRSGEWRAKPAVERCYIEALVWAVLVEEFSGARARVLPAI